MTPQPSLGLGQAKDPQAPLEPMQAHTPQNPLARRRPRVSSPDMFADSPSTSCSNDFPYQASQGGAGYGTQLAFALSVSEVSAVLALQH